MSTPTPRTDDVYLEHRYWANEDEATEAIEDLRDLARELERELAIELERATHYRDEWQKERAKARALRDACESICEEWGDNYNTNPIGAGLRMATRAGKVLEAMEGAE